MFARISENVCPVRQLYNTFCVQLTIKIRQRVITAPVIPEATKDKQDFTKISQARIRDNQLQRIFPNDEEKHKHLFKSKKLKTIFRMITSFLGTDWTSLT